MVSQKGTCLGRRKVLKSAGGLVFGTTALSQTGSVSAQEGSASVTLNAQESAGNSVVLASLQTDVDARVYITPVRQEDDDLLHKVLDLSAGASFTDRTIQLDEPIEESKTVSAVIQAGEDYDQVIADDTALIAVGQSLTAARASQVPGGELELISADPAAGFHYPYLLYRPEIQQQTGRPLYVQPHNSRRAESRDELTEQLYQRGEWYLQPAITLSLPGLIPGFPRPPEDGADLVQTLALEMLDTESKRQEVATDAFPAETLHRVDRQLVSMVEDAMERLETEPYPVDDEIHMNGFSAAGSFNTRFALLHPDRVGSMSLGGGGARPLPHATHDGITLPYPLGTADYQEWTDREFDHDAWTAIDQYIYVGEEDQPLPEEDTTGYYSISARYENKAEEVYGINRVTERFPVTRSVYDEAGASATFQIYEGVGHEITRSIYQDITAFHRRTSDAQHAQFELTLQRSADQIAVGTPITVTVQARNRMSEQGTIEPTFFIDETEMETVERNVAPNESTKLTFEHTFDEPGSYSLYIDGRQVGDRPVTVIEPTATPEPTATESAAINQSPATDSSVATEASGPGFEVSTALAGVAGLSYLLRVRKDD